MALSSRQLAQALDASVQENPDATEKIVERFVVFCKERSLGNLLPSVLEHLERMNSDRQKNDTVRIRVARDLDESVIKQIRASVESDAPVTVDVDEALIGGFVALYRNTIYDGSVKRQLERAQKALVR